MAPSLYPPARFNGPALYVVLQRTPDILSVTPGLYDRRLGVICGGRVCYEGVHAKFARNEGSILIKAQIRAQIKPEQFFFSSPQREGLQVLGNKI